jgi:RNA recognition motif-containing protein
MGTKLYVGNLSYQTTQSQLEALFAQAGEVTEATIVEDRETGRPRGFGFVEMANEAGARAAVEQFNGREIDGRTINVAEARPREPRSFGGSRDTRDTRESRDTRYGGGGGTRRW